jgi:hypothetical protein
VTELLSPHTLPRALPSATPLWMDMPVRSKHQVGVRRADGRHLLFAQQLHHYLGLSAPSAPESGLPLHQTPHRRSPLRPPHSHRALVLTSTTAWPQMAAGRCAGKCVSLRLAWCQGSR